MTEPHDAYYRLIALLDQHGATYRLIDHPAEGRTEIVSVMRGHPVEHAAKCMVLMAKLGRKTTKHVLAVVPGNARVNLNGVKAMLGASYVSFASESIAEELAGSIIGTVLPFSFDYRLELIVDADVLRPSEMYFNAARLDRSIALLTSDYQRIASPRLERLAAR